MPTAADNPSLKRLFSFNTPLIIRVAQKPVELEAIMAFREDLVASAVSLSRNDYESLLMRPLGDM
mgnify:CR=1 FL=1